MEERITLDQLIELVEEVRKDYDKFYDKGVKAAATRLRKGLQDIIKISKDMRVQAIEHKKSL